MGSIKMEPFVRGRKNRAGGADARPKPRRIRHDAASTVARTGLARWSLLLTAIALLPLLVLLYVFDPGGPMSRLSPQTLRTHLHLFVFFSALGRVLFITLAMYLMERARRTDTRLRDSEERLRSITDSANAAIVAEGPNGGIVFWNKAAEAIFGYTEAEALGRPLTDIMPERYREVHRKALDRAKRSGQYRLNRKTVQMQGLRKDGSEFAAELSLGSWDSADGVCNCGFIRDISLRNQGLEMIREREEFLKRIIESSHDCINVLSLDGRLLFASDGGLAPRDSDNFAGPANMSWVRFWLEEDRPLAERALETARAGHTGSFQGYCPSTLGVPKWWDVVVTAVLDADGLPERLLTVAREITAQRQAETEMRNTAHELSSVIETVSEGITLSNETGYFRLFNARMEEMTGYTRAEANAAGDFARLIYPDREAHHIATARLDDIISVGHGRDLETTITTKDGTLRTLLVSTTILPSSDGNMFLTAYHDVTARRTAEDSLRLSEARFQAFMDNSPVTAFTKDAQGRYQYVNRTLLERLGGTREEWLGSKAEDHWSPAFADAVTRNDTVAMAQDGCLETTMSLTTSDGRTRHFLTYRFPLDDGNGGRLMAGMSLDITDRNEADRALRAERDFVRTVMNTAGSLIVVLDAQGRITRFNAECERLTGYAFEAVSGQCVWDLVLPPEEVDVVRSGFEALAAGVVSYALENTWLTPNGGRALIAWTLTALLDADGSLEHVIGTGIDITERKRIEHELRDANAQLESLATSDSLTGIHNRRAFRKRLEEECERTRRQGTPLSLILLDVDHFKAYNDAYGHPAGDLALRKVATVLALMARTTDLVARYGGEEFAVVLPQTDGDGAFALAERLRVALESAGWDHRNMTASLGVATLTPATPDSEGLIAEADRAMYVSKTTGRNRVTDARTMTVQAVRRT